VACERGYNVYRAPVFTGRGHRPWTRVVCTEI